MGGLGGEEEGTNRLDTTHRGHGHHAPRPTASAKRRANGGGCLQGKEWYRSSKRVRAYVGRRQLGRITWHTGPRPNRGPRSLSPKLTFAKRAGLVETLAAPSAPAIVQPPLFLDRPLPSRSSSDSCRATQAKRVVGLVHLQNFSAPLAASELPESHPNRFTCAFNGVGG